MEPKDYYYNQFTSDLKELMKKVNVIGNHAFDFVEPFSAGKYGFMIVELFKSSKQDALEHIAKENLGYFLPALAGIILIDQIMFTYFKGDYEKFRTITLYPKIRWSPGWNANIKPWQLFEHQIALERGLQNPQKSNQFSDFMDFFIADLKDFFEKQNFPNANWLKVKEVMLNDKDVYDSDFGKIFCNKLKQA